MILSFRLHSCLNLKSSIFFLGWAFSWLLSELIATLDMFFESFPKETILILIKDFLHDLKNV